MNSTRVRLNHPVPHAGRVTFAVSSTNLAGDSDITLFRPRPGHTLNEVFGALAEEFSETSSAAAKRTRDLVHDVRTYGLADVSPARGALVARSLSPGTYYLMDLGNPPQSGPPAVTRLTVERHGGYRAKALHRHARAAIKMTSADRFRVRGTMPAAGTVRVVNTSDSLHFVTFQRVKPGTTDRQVQQYSAPGGLLRSSAVGDAEPDHGHRRAHAGQGPEADLSVAQRHLRPDVLRGRRPGCRTPSWACTRSFASADGSAPGWREDPRGRSSRHPRGCRRPVPLMSAGGS